MKIRTPLQVATVSLEESIKLMAYLRKKKRHAQVEAVKRQIDAFQRLVSDSNALQQWWDSISPEGQQLMLDSLD